MEFQRKVLKQLVKSEISTSRKFFQNDLPEKQVQGIRSFAKFVNQSVMTHLMYFPVFCEEPVPPRK